MTIGAGYAEDDRFLHVAPMFHLADGSSIYALIWRGACHVVVPTSIPRACCKPSSRSELPAPSWCRP